MTPCPQCEPTPQSVHLLQGQGSLVVSYLHHGIVLGFFRYLSSGGVTPFVGAGTRILYPLSGKSRRGHIKCLFKSYSAIALSHPSQAGDLVYRWIVRRSPSPTCSTGSICMISQAAVWSIPSGRQLRTTLLHQSYLMVRVC